MTLNSIFKLILITILFTCPFGDQISSIVETKLGKLKGIESKSILTERPYFEFKGIPYAKPPIGDLRFKLPVKYDESWEGVRDASKYGSICPQMNVYNTSIVEGNEDCLFLNVFIPKLEEHESKNKKLPVLVVIHGGSFQYESGSDYDPTYWMEDDLIVVTFNYRLSIFGFLKLPQNGIYGNMGLKDQVLALKWVQENIEMFNGDPNRVTIMGISSGGVSVHLHMLSPMSKGLFHQAISQSGTALDPWGIPNKDRTGLLAKMLRCDKTVELFDCLHNMTSDQIMLVQGSFNDWFIDPLVPIGPIIESGVGDNAGPENRFLTDSPLKLIMDGNYNAVPWIIGVNSEEGLLHSSDIVTHGALLRVLDWEWEKAAPITLIYPNFSKEDSKNVSTIIRNYYFQNDTFVEEPSLIFDRLTNMYSDRYFFRGAHHSAKFHAATKTPVYLYLFNHKGQQSLAELSQSSSKNEKLAKNVRGVGHYDQIPYFFNTPFFEPIVDELEMEIAGNFVASFAKFVIDGTPSNGDWKAVPEDAISSLETLRFNQLGLTPEMVDEPWTDRIKFWDSVLPLSEEVGQLSLHKEAEDWINSIIKDEL